ncbi:hypothetical protein OAE55_08830, partial [Gammaproteobacteria bacterium]|nr:hypothetical protein [Gammaproteobacteria bacterium]
DDLPCVSSTPSSGRKTSCRISIVGSIYPIHSRVGRLSFDVRNALIATLLWKTQAACKRC